MRSALQRLTRQALSSARGFSSVSYESALGAGEAAAPLLASQTPTTIIDVPTRVLMGPGPSNSHPRVLTAQALPLLGHMHPPFFKIMDEIQAGLRYMFQTESKYTCLVTGSGHAGMEALIANLLEPGETIVVGNNGIWGARVCDLAERYQANVVNLEAPAGQGYSLEQLTAAVEQHKPAVLFVVQGESSTGVQQSLAGLGELCRKHNTLLAVDTVCTLGGVPLFADAWGIDAIYSGSQKCLSAPPGAAPFMFSERAFQKLTNRKSKVASYYLDATLFGDYWGWFDKRFYHHTGAVSTWYGMREALAITSAEGLDSLWARHHRVHEALWEGLRGIGLEPFVEDPAFRLATVNTIKVPDGIDWAKLNAYVMDKYSVEIAGGLGPTMGKVWRIGVMGYNATDANVALVVAALKDGLEQQGYVKR